MGAAFTGATALFLMRPTKIGNVARDLLPAMKAARESGIARVAFLSVLGADRNRLLPHHTVETWLARSGMQTSAIRAGNFMQNLATVHAADIRDRDQLAVPAGNAAMSYVDARDVGAVAARCLLDDNHAGHTYTPTGLAAITHAEIATILTRELRRPIRYTRPSLPRYWLRAHRTGMPTPTIAVTSILYTLARLGIGSQVTRDVSTVLGRPATPFTQFAHDHRTTWNG